MPKKFTITTLVLLASLGLAVSGCLKKPVAQPVNQNTNANTNVATTTAEIDMSNWKTYRNEEYGFEFKYPEGWELSKPEYSTKLNSAIKIINHSIEPYGKDGDIMIDIFARESTLSLKEWFDTNSSYNEVSLKKIVDFMDREMGKGYLLPKDIITYGDEYKLGQNFNAFVRYAKFLKPEYIEGPAYTHKIYAFKIGQKIYTFSASVPTGQHSEYLIKIFDKIVETVVFMM